MRHDTLETTLDYLQDSERSDRVQCMLCDLLQRNETAVMAATQRQRI